jgi:glyoxylate/hydroxypyruvate/2-ketogluconate reductase
MLCCAHARAPAEVSPPRQPLFLHPMQKTLITRAVFREIVAALEERFDVDYNADDRPWPPEELARRLQGKHGAMATVMDKFDEPLLAQCPDLRVISNIAVG